MPDTTTTTGYRVTFTRIGHTRNLAYDVTGLDPATATADDLARRVHDFAAKYLTSRLFGVDVDLATGQGWIEGGRFGTFTITPLNAEETSRG